jgi:hypothetical protein
MIEGGHGLLSFLVWMPFRRRLASLFFWPGRCETFAVAAKFGYLVVIVDASGTRWATTSVDRTWRRRP